jgi:hypothetical protein
VEEGFEGADVLRDLDVHVHLHDLLDTLLIVFHVVVVSVHVPQESHFYVLLGFVYLLVLGHHEQIILSEIGE